MSESAGIQRGNWKDGSYAILPNGGAFVTVSKYRTAIDQPTPPKDVNRFTTNRFDRYADWGEDNLQPTNWRKKLDKSTIALSTIYKLIQMTYGQGLAWGHTERNEDGSVTRIYEKSPAIKKWMRKNRYKKYLAKRIVNYRFFGNIWSEMILSRDKTQINRIQAKDSEFVRLERQNEKSLRIEMIGYCADWQYQQEQDIARIPLVDEYNPQEWIKEKLLGWKFAQWSYFPSPGRIYYKHPYWGGIFRDKGWLDNANNIPELINAMDKNQVRFRYHIKIPFDYWVSKYPEWETYDNKKRTALMDLKFEEMDDYLSGPDATGKTFTSHFGIDPISKKVLPGWEIVAVDDKFKHDAYIPNSKAADQQIVQSLGLDPTLIGLEGTNSSMGGGSGSDKRVSFFNQFALNTIEQEIILEDFDLIQEFNRWDDLEFWFEQTVPARLDKEPTGSQVT